MLLGPWAPADSAAGLRFGGQDQVTSVASVPPCGVWRHPALWPHAPGTSQQLAEISQAQFFAISRPPAVQPHFNWKELGTELTEGPLPTSSPPRF